MSEEKPSKKAFTIRIDFVKGSFSLMNAQVVELYFIEDIFSPFINGKLTFIDTMAILEKGPLTGNETISIMYTGSGEENNTVIKTFTVFKISEVTSLSNSANTSTIIELHFVDPFYMSFCIEQYSRSWKDKKGEEIIKEIVTKLADVDEKYLELDNWEESTDPFESYYMPWWTCLNSIKWLMKRMKSSKSETSGYLFYANSFESEKREGMSTLNLRTIDSLLSETTMMKINEEDDSLYTFTESNVEFKTDKNRIFSFTLDGIDKSSIKTLAGCHYYGFDSKKNETIDQFEGYTYANMLTKHTVLGESSLFMDLSVKNAGRKFTGEQDTKIIDNIAYDDWVKRYAMQNYMHVVVDGHEKRYAGGLIEVNFPPRIPSASDLSNVNLSGKYLIKSITNYFNPNDSLGYLQKMTLIKNGYDANIDILLPATKKNIITGKNLGAQNVPEDPSFRLTRS